MLYLFLSYFSPSNVVNDNIVLMDLIPVNSPRFRGHTWKVYGTEFSGFMVICEFPQIIERSEVT